MVMMQVTADCDFASTLASLPSLSLECLFCCEQWHLCFPLPGLQFHCEAEDKPLPLPQFAPTAVCSFTVVLYL